MSNVTQKKSKQRIYWFYRSYVGRAIRCVAVKKWFSALIGWYADTRISRMHIAWLIRTFEIDMQEALYPQIQAYKTLNDFFIRELQPHARPIDRVPEHIISPADGIYTFHELKNGATFDVKGIQIELGQLLQDDAHAQQYADGWACIMYLAPHNYHRFHAPADGIISSPIVIRGRYETVEPSIYTYVQPLLINERQLITLQTAHAGAIALVAVGAWCVGAIHLMYQANAPIGKGAQLGYFSFGGSSLVLLFEKNAIEKPRAGYHHIAMGQTLATGSFQN